VGCERGGDAKTDAKTKGIGFHNVRTFTLDRYGLEGWVDVLAELVPEDRRVLDEMLPVGWYSLPLYARVIRALDEVHGAGDLALVVQLGRYEAERDLTTIQRAFLRMASPAFLLEKSADYWRRFHDTGTWSIQREGTTRVRAYLDGWGHVDTVLCRELIGYFSRAFELVGARKVWVDHAQCRAFGGDRCLFVGGWGEG
jgi:predicted hydrocarbon binding protein